MKNEENGHFPSFTRTSHGRPMHLVTSIREFGTHRLASHIQSMDESQTQIKHNTMKGVKTGTHGVFNNGPVARNPVFGVSDKTSFKPVSSATETS